MALIGNYSVLNKSVAQFTNGTATAGAYAAITPSNYKQNGMAINRFAGEQSFPNFSAVPSGYVPPYAWIFAMQSGGLASYTGLSASVSATDALLALGINIDSSLSASISITDAILALIVGLEANLSANGTITNAQLAIILQMQAALTGSGTITTADLENILSMMASLSATGTLTNSITTLVNLSADIGGATPLSPEGLAQAVWTTILSDFDSNGNAADTLKKAKMAAENAFAVSS
jgi:hypothetical protein